jgi:hypothetical protein
MADNPQHPEPTKDWRFPLSIGLAIGCGLATGRAINDNLTTSLGSIGAFVVGLLASSAVAGLVALFVFASSNHAKPRVFCTFL